ncbi:MAG: beta-CASP ribonuclease aCPSF1 [Candidatus Altiarchaeota archaeon]|nr:beta-CASP ribonuclease aCPSF1 [Candidatus Altiarchaeota archaeon]
MSGEEVLTRVLSLLPSKADIGESRFEAANVVIFSKNFDFFMNAHEVLREVAKEVKLRIEARADRSLLMPAEDAESEIRKIIKDAGVTDIFFDTYGSKVIIEVEKPSEVLGNGNNKITEIKKKTAWTPVIQRKPPLKSDIINTIRRIWTQNSKDRSNFLHGVGKRIYEDFKETEWTRVSFLGAAREVGRSSMLLQTNGSRVLMDCGINVANKDKAFPVLDAPEFQIERLDAVVISHSHLDHVGFTPFLYKYGFKGPVYMTPPSLPLAVLLSLDAMEIAHKDGGNAPYSSKEIEQMVLHTIPLPYEEVTNITPDVRLTLYNAGHILGSSIIHFHIGEGFYNLVYTGDMKYGPTKMHDSAVNKFPRVEAVMIESTYGSPRDLLPSLKDAQDSLVKEINEVIDNKGKILIPTAGVGRVQEVMLTVEEAVRNGTLPEIPIYIDGMVWDATAIYTTYPEYLRKNIRKLVFSNEENPLLNPLFKRVGGQKDRKSIVDADESSIIMATSGMLNGGPSVFYLSQLAPYEKNKLIFVTYQGRGTLGETVMHQPKDILINQRDRIPLNMKVVKAEGFSAHSDRKQLLSYLKNMEPRPGLIMPVHGDPAKLPEFASTIRNTLRMSTKIPNILDSIRLK